MAREHLSKRGNWEASAVGRGHQAEANFRRFMGEHLRSPGMIGTSRPRNLEKIYGGERGIRPDYSIQSARTGKIVFVEIKRQRAAGNAHERACKYFAPGILASMREAGGHPEGVIPFWWIFTNGIASDARYQMEIRHWFKGVERHLLLWEDITDGGVVTRHFDRHIRRLLK